LPSTRASRFQALAGEPLGHQGEEVRDLGFSGELVVAGREEQLDRLSAEAAFELRGEATGRVLEHNSLLSGNVFVLRQVSCSPS